MADADVNYGRGYQEDRGIGQPSPMSAAPTAGAHTEQPERDLEPGNPNLTGAAPPAAKKGMANKVKGLFEGVKGHGQQKTGSGVGSGVGHTPESSPHGTAANDHEFTGHSSLDPTAAPAGNNFRQQGGAKSLGPWPHPTNPRGHTNAQGGATLTDEHGNLHRGPQDDVDKKEGFLSKIKDKLHSPK